MKQPRVPEYRESEGVSRYLRALNLFLKDFCLETWKDGGQAKKSIDGIAYPVTSVNGETGDVQLDASDVGARPDTWTPSASDVGALPAGGTAVNAGKLGGKEPGAYLQTSKVLDTLEEVTANTTGGMVAGAKAVKELNEDVSDAVRWIFPEGKAVNVLSHFTANGTNFQAPGDGILLISYYGGFAGMGVAEADRVHNGEGGWNSGSSSTPSSLRIFMRAGATGTLWYSATLLSAYFVYCK